MGGEHAASSRDGTNNAVQSRDCGVRCGKERAFGFCRSAFTHRVHMGFSENSNKALRPIATIQLPNWLRMMIDSSDLSMLNFVLLGCFRDMMRLLLPNHVVLIRNVLVGLAVGRRQKFPGNRRTPMSLIVSGSCHVRSGIARPRVPT